MTTNNTPNHEAEYKEPLDIEEAEDTQQVEDETPPVEEILPEEPEQRLQELQEKLEDSEGRLLRLHAEYENYRKRTTKEKTEIYPEATARTVAQFLPVLDNFERAMEFDAGTDEFKEGVELIYTSLREVLTALGVEEIGQRGEPFDPELHNAVMRCEDEELGENCVATVLQKGYRIGDKIVRHAIVETAN